MAFRKSNAESTSEQLKADLHHLTKTIEDLVSATADDSRGNIKELRQRAEKRLRETRSRLGERGEHLYDDTRDQVVDQFSACDKYVHSNPWTSVGIGTAVGVVIGLLIGRS
ncbi:MULTISPECIES: YqjD family protein [Halomonadaceae]|uniref:DUF883 family protein n=1 Tax=Halomonadaceae TaxID=28256 RepID=UPI001598714A|nr:MULTISPECIES: DUF883 family protein [Halomonas]QJQ94943.1 DUF883 domain-containing protein [Halomonas sp. PA5]